MADTDEGTPVPSRLQDDERSPKLLQTLSTNSSVLSLTYSQTHLFAGLVNDIQAWDLNTLQLSAVLAGHTDSVLAVSLKNNKTSDPFNRLTYIVLARDCP